jgi:hypothetical protein
MNKILIILLVLAGKRQVITEAMGKVPSKNIYTNQDLNNMTWHHIDDLGGNIAQEFSKLYSPQK